MMELLVNYQTGEQSLVALSAEETAERVLEEQKRVELAAKLPMQQLRTRRNQLLAETDWVTLKTIDASTDGLGLQLPQAWVDYRQALRDLPANTADPSNPVWPVKPVGS